MNRWKYSCLLMLYIFTKTCFRVIGLPSEEEWPADVTLSRKNFAPVSPRPITDFVPEIDAQGAQLLQVRFVKSSNLCKSVPFFTM